MTIVIKESEISPSFNPGQRKILRRLANTIESAFPAGTATSGEYTPTVTNELNAGGTITIVDPWAYVQVGDYVFVQMNLIIDSNASGGAYQVEAKFTLPVATTDISTIAGSASAVDTDADTVVFSVVIEGRNGSSSGTPGAIINTFYPTDCGIARIKGTFAYKVVA